MRVLFFPSDIGGGFGHVSRCIALADQACQRGNSCAFVLNDKKFEKRVASRFPVDIVAPYAGLKRRLLSPVFEKFRSRNGNKPLYLGISGLDFQLVRDGLVTAKAIEHTLRGYQRAVQRFRPDVLVGDINLLVRFLSHLVELPCVQIVRYAFHPDTAELIWWQDKPSGIQAPDTLSIVNPALAKLGLGAIEACNDMLRGDLYIVPSIPEIEPVPREASNTSHVGPLVMASDKTASQTPIDAQIGSKPLIYITIGGGAGPVGNQKLFSNIIDAFRAHPAQVIVSTGGKSDLPRVEDLPSNVKMFDWVPADRVIPMADLVVFHGGYGTMMETVAAGKPSVVIPFHTEQEGNGRRLEQLGCAKVLRLSKEPFSSLKVRAAWGEYSYVIQNRYDMNPSMLIDCVDAILRDHRYTDAAKALQGRLVSYGGANQAMELIERSFG